MIIAELKIKEYIKMFRRKYANVNLIPKQHLLEFHCIDWLKRFGFGMAFHGKQWGGGRLHAYLNRIKQSSTGILKEGDRMKYIMKTAITQNAPELRTIVPSSKKKKKKKKKKKRNID